MATGPDEFHHLPVLVDTVVDLLAPVPAGWVVDGTVGGAGHARAVLDAHRHLSVLGIDRDPTAVAVASERLAGFGARARVVRATFDEVGRVVDDAGVAPLVGGLLDLGVSSPQLDHPGRGFSYRHEGPLDMRMDPDHGQSAADIVNTWDESSLADLLRRNADERFAARIAKAIVAARPLSTTTELAEIVRGAYTAPARRRAGGDPARRTFQALRIEVNDELERIAPTIQAIVDRLEVGGRLIVLAYHSGEDRLVKSMFRELSTGGCTCPPGLDCVCGAVPTIRVLRSRAWKAQATDVERNPRAEAVRLRAIERIPTEGAS